VAGGPAGLALTAASFLIGAIPWGYISGKVSRGIDLRTVGSGGTGATNVLRALGAKTSAIVLLLDIMKGMLPVVLMRELNYTGWWLAAAAVAAVAGHCWSPFIGFKGGKGVATGAGAAIALVPQMLLILPVMAVVVWKSKFVSLGSLVAAALAVALAVGLAASGHASWSAAAATLIISGIIALRHRSNIDRLWHGTERRIGERVAT
jgi:glycerol-3-phosphate acyltransferase PlsY